MDALGIRNGHSQSERDDGRIAIEAYELNARSTSRLPHEGGSLTMDEERPGDCSPRCRDLCKGSTIAGGCGTEVSRHDRRQISSSPARDQANGRPHSCEEQNGDE